MRHLLACLALLALPASARAHRLDATATLADGVVRVTAEYDDGDPAAGAKATVTLGTQEVITGVLDAAGAWSFPAPLPGAYRVRVDDGAGHRGRATFTVPGSPAEVVAPPPPAEPDRPFPRWARTLIGLAVIALAAAIARRALARRAPGPTPHAPPTTGRPAGPAAGVASAPGQGPAPTP